MTEKDFHLVSSAIEKEKENLKSLSLEIWRKPELRYEEVYAHSVLTKALENYGFSVQAHYHLETAFRAEFSSGNEGPSVAVLCEYDALPEMGHACGHNLIAECGVAAAIGVKTVMEADASIAGKVIVLGCPAEEGGGGKIRLIERGTFDDIDVALMSHPGSRHRVIPYMLCKLSVDVTYTGMEAHASAYPWEGRNALDAAVAAYVNIGLLRQQIKPSCRIHGIIREGGTAPNVIPGRTKLELYVRAETSGELETLKKKVKHCLHSAAEATGCEVEYKFYDSDTYLNVISNKVLASLFREYSESMGIVFTEENAEGLATRPRSAGSTDMGNVSYVVPSIHTGFQIGCHGIHTPEFAKLAATDAAHQAARTAAKALALTAMRVMRSSKLLQQVKDSFQEDIALMKVG